MCILFGRDNAMHLDVVTAGNIGSEYYATIFSGTREVRGVCVLCKDAYAFNRFVMFLFGWDD